MRSRSRRRSLKRARKAKRERSSKEIPHFDWDSGEKLGQDQRYTVSELLGDGTFGRVLACRDSETGERVAVKVVKGVKRFFEHAEAEAEVIRDIQKLDKRNESRTVELRNTFVHDTKFFCLVFEPLDMSLRDFLKKNDGQGLTLLDIRAISSQFLKGLEVLHSIGLVHCDLKCRNIMLRDASSDHVSHPRVLGEETRKLRNPAIVIIDFGGAVFEEDRHDGRIGTRQFRPPEVVLGLKWDEKADIWSAGCIIGMLYLGKRIFSMHEDMEFFAICEKALEKEIPSSMVATAMVKRELEGIVFHKDSDGTWRLAWPSSAPDSDAIERVDDIIPIRQRVCARHSDFLSLVFGLLELEPGRRLSATAALQLPFFADGVELQE